MVTLSIDPGAGTLVPSSEIIDLARLTRDFFDKKPDVAIPAQRVSFGTSGHRGSAFDTSFNENHIAAISQAICRYRASQGIDGPLYMGRDTHALSEPAFQVALEVLSANGVGIMIDAGNGFTPTPVISHAILGYNRGRSSGLADGIVITPSHNPPQDGGFKYNPPEGGPADTARSPAGFRTWPISFLGDGLKGIQRSSKVRSAPSISPALISPTWAASSIWMPFAPRACASASIRWAARRRITGSPWRRNTASI